MDTTGSTGISPDTSRSLPLPNAKRLSLLNRLIDSDYLFDVEIESNKCLIPIPWEINDKLCIPYGKADVPFLNKLLFDSNCTVICKSLQALIEKSYDCLKAMDILRSDVLLALGRLIRHAEPFVRQRCCVLVAVLAGQPTGKVSVVRNGDLMNGFVELLEDDDNRVRFHCAAALAALAQNRLGNEIMAAEGRVHRLLDRTLVEPDEQVLRALLRAVGWLTSTVGGTELTSTVGETEPPTEPVERLMRGVRSPDYGTALVCVARLSRFVAASPAVADRLARDHSTVGLLVQMATTPALGGRALRPFSLQLLCGLMGTRVGLASVHAAVKEVAVSDLQAGLDDDDDATRKYLRKLIDAVNRYSKKLE